MLDRPLRDDLRKRPVRQSVVEGRLSASCQRPKRSPVTGSRYSFELLPCDEWKSNRFFNVPLMASNDPAIRGRLQLSSMSVSIDDCVVSVWSV